MFRMRRAQLIGTVLLFSFHASSWSQLDGALPIPVLDNVGVSATVSYNAVTDRYTYEYTVTNPASNTGEIDGIHIDVSNPSPGNLTFSDVDFVIPYGITNITFTEALETLAGFDSVPVIPFGLTVPAGWRGSIAARGTAFISSSDILTAVGQNDKILPGETTGGFELFTVAPPTFRKIVFIPDWIYISTDTEGTSDEEGERAREISAQIRYTSETLGPAAVRLGSFTHWDQVRNDIDRSIQKGWIMDTILADALVAQLASARDALNAEDGTLAKNRLHTLLTTITQSISAQRRQEVFDLVRLNAQKLIEYTSDTPIPFEPKLTLTPERAELPIGTQHSVTATLTNVAHNNEPIVGERIPFYIIDGPHSGLGRTVNTDPNGMATFSYVGKRVGTDTIVILGEEPSRYMPRPETMVAAAGDLSTLRIPVIAFLDAGSLGGEAKVTWNGGPDMAVPFFMPPMIISKGGNSVFISDVTTNIGNLPSISSTTRYYLSDQQPVNPATAIVLGERNVKDLIPEELDNGSTLEFTIPAGLSEATYYLAACADATDLVVELDEGNNCSYSQLKGIASMVVPAITPSNSPPDCSGAMPGVGKLWPPNHKPATVAIRGVSDPDSDPVTMRVDAITQDEPVNAKGDGDTAPDGFGIGEAQAQLRAERSGKGNGRVYRIGFTANDGRGGSCTGSVTVGVPHDQGRKTTPIDDGQNYDSTASS